MITIIVRYKIILNLDYNVQTVAIRKLEIFIGYTYDIFVLINQTSNSHEARKNKYHENRMFVDEVVRNSIFLLFVIRKMCQKL